MKGFLCAGLIFLILIGHVLVDIIQNGKAFFCVQVYSLYVSHFINVGSILIISEIFGLPLAVTTYLAYHTGKMKD